MNACKVRMGIEKSLLALFLFLIPAKTIAYSTRAGTSHINRKPKTKNGLRKIKVKYYFGQKTYIFFYLFLLYVRIKRGRKE